MIAGRVLVPVLAAGLLIGGGVPGSPALAAQPTAGAAAKPKRIKCRKSQVPIKINRRKVGCRSRSAALPRPRRGDSRMLYARLALADNLAGVRDRRGRRAPALKKLFRKVNPHAWAAVQSGLRKGLGRLDKLAAASRTVARLARTSECGGADPPTRSDTFSSNAGGEKLTATMTFGRETVLALDLESGNYVIHLELADGRECHHFDAPACPTAAGVVDATDSSVFLTALSIAKDGKVLVSQRVHFAGNTRMHAEVNENAKLDFIDIDDSQTANIDLGGSRQSFGPVSLHYTGLHRTRVKMPGRSYDAGRGAVDIAFTERGVTFGKSQLGQDAAAIARSLDNEFATLVDKEITNFQKLETGWDVPNACVKLQFDPASLTRTLHRHQHGTMSAQAIAVQGGGASFGKWDASAPQNARFSPDSATGASPQFSYDVTNAGKDIFVKLTLHVTSRAGVGEDTWTQKTEDAPVYRGTVSGTRNFELSGTCSTEWHWSYSARLADIAGADQPFAILTLDPGSGIEFGGAGAYDETGSGSYTRSPCPQFADPGCSTALARDPGFGPGLVSFSVDADTVTADVDASDFTGTCDHDWSRFLGRGTFPRSSIGDETIPVSLSWTDGSSGTLTLTRAD